MEGSLEDELCAQPQIAGLIEWAPLGGSHRSGVVREAVNGEEKCV